MPIVENHFWHTTFYPTEYSKGITSVSNYRNKFLVHYAYNDGNRIRRLFGVFESAVSFMGYADNLPRHKRNFFETIIGANPQKPYFDIDIKDEDDLKEKGDSTIKDLVSCIMKAYPGVKMEDILVFSSHSDKKQSFHVVVNNWCVSGNVENGYFSRGVCDLMKKETKKYIDPLYSPLQQFRMLFSMKSGSNREKIFVPTVVYDGVPYTNKEFTAEEGDSHYDVSEKESTLFLSACVTMTARCKKMKIEVNEFDKKIKRAVMSGSFPETSLTTAEVKNAMDEIKEYIKAFTFREVSNNRIDLRRIHASMCIVCNRTHTAENAFLTITPTDITFYCRRNSEGKKRFPRMDRLLGTSNDLLAGIDFVSELREDESELEMQRALATAFSMDIPAGFTDTIILPLEVPVKSSDTSVKKIKKTKQIKSVKVSALRSLAAYRR